MNDQYGKLIEPDPVQFEFGAPGWYVLGGLVLLIIVIICWLLIRHWQRNRYRGNALKWLSAKEQELAQQPQQLTFETNFLMKRLALTRYGRQQTASLRGTEWIKLLNVTVKKELFLPHDVLLLEQELYTGGTKQAEINNFLDKAKYWIKHHKRNMNIEDSEFQSIPDMNSAQNTI